MRIGEIAEKTGLSISNIRFYERKGLIGPQREEESKYRSYTQEDLQRLQLILLYRRMELPVETIGRILEGEVRPEDALEQQLLDLKARQQTLQSSIDLCRKVIEDGAYEISDPELYLNYVKEEESKGNVFAKIDDIIEDFSEFTRFDRLMEGTYLGWDFLSRTWINRIILLAWFGLFMIMPVVGIAEDILEYGSISMVKLTFWILWILFFGISFICYRRGTPRK